jgi:hypothetical protein
MSFDVDLSKFINKTNQSADKIIRSIKLDLFSSVIIATRVDTGRLRGNWQTSTGSPILSTTERLDKTEQGVGGGAAIEDVMSTVQGYTVDYMTNNLPYAAVYEEKDGMIAKNMARIERIVKESVKDL